MLFIPISRKFSLASLSVPQDAREPPFSCSYLKWNEDFQDSSIWKGPLASHCYHHTPLHCSLNLNLGRGQSFHCYYSWLRCLHQQIRSWNTAGSSCRQADGEPGGSAAEKEKGESTAPGSYAQGSGHQVLLSKSCVGFLSSALPTACTMQPDIIGVHQGGSLADC